MEFKCPARANFDHITVTEQKTSSFVAHHSDEFIVNIGTIGRLKIFAVDQWRVCGIFFLLVDDGVDAQMLFRNPRVFNLGLTMWLFSADRRRDFVCLTNFHPCQ